MSDQGGKQLLIQYRGFQRLLNGVVSQPNTEQSLLECQSRYVCSGFTVFQDLHTLGRRIDKIKLITLT